ncbi:MAG: DUF4139 domain-containing protein [Alphaproteobacteria bacterium]|nr:DUF4139 domain-containing protein [Alphaproteobacteria bacterium]
MLPLRFVLGSSLAIGLLVSTPAGAADLALKRVLLSSGGVGYFEYEAKVSGTETVSLDVRLDQMDDVLKSLVVFDDQGGGGIVEMPSRSPLTEIFRSLPIAQQSLQSPELLMAALQGAEVQVDGPVSASGRIVSVTGETATNKDGAQITRHRVGLMTSSGLVQFVLEEAETIYFKDPTLRAQLEQALASVARHRLKDGRTLTITARGEGERVLTVAYVAEAPLWKSSYRLTTGGESATTARLQGWAIIENASGRDWKDVELTLTSGNPVTFRQALYTAYYVPRPEIPVEVLGRVLPNLDEGGIALGDSESMKTRGMLDGRAERMSEESVGMAAGAPMPMSLPAPAMEAAADYMSGERDDQPYAVTASDAAAQVIFRIPNTISVGTGQSLAVPIIDRSVPGQQIALYQPATHPRHPLAAVRLTNDSETGLPPGVLTLYETTADGTAYVGDARLSVLPKAETRYLAFALDQDLTLDREDKFEQRVTKANLARGILRLSVVQQRTSVYTIKGAADRARSLVIEHPRDAGWSLTTPSNKEVEATDSAFRIPFTAASGATQSLTVVTETTRQEVYSLVDMDFTAIEQNAMNRGLSEAQRQVFEKMKGMRRDIDTALADIAAATAERERLFQEQERIRENLQAVPERSDIAQRYLASLSAQEDRLEALAQTIKAGEERRDSAQAALADFVGDIEL